MQLTLVRYGGLSSVRQEGYDPSMPGFHSPPARRGIYAFVEQTVTFFLLGQDHFDSRRAEWVLDEEGNRIPASSPLAGDGMTRRAKDGVLYVARHKKPKRFTHEGALWHHLPVRHSSILRQKGSWVLTTGEIHKAAFQREYHKRLYAQKQYHPSRLLDEFEVFIEKV